MLIISLTMTLVHHLYRLEAIHAFSSVTEREAWLKRKCQALLELMATCLGEAEQRKLWHKYDRILVKHCVCLHFNMQGMRQVLRACAYSKPEEHLWHLKWGCLTWRAAFVVQEWLLWSAGGALIPLAWGETAHSGHGLCAVPHNGILHHLTLWKPTHSSWQRGRARNV